MDVVEFFGPGGVFLDDFFILLESNDPDGEILFVKRSNFRTLDPVIWSPLPFYVKYDIHGRRIKGGNYIKSLKRKTIYLESMIPFITGIDPQDLDLFWMKKALRLLKKQQHVCIA